MLFPWAETWGRAKVDKKRTTNLTNFTNADWGAIGSQGLRFVRFV
jgi:hypothetical protein